MKSIKNTRRSGFAVAAALLSSASFSPPAFAQDAPAAQEEFPGEILVTARRKSENILRTPISITALNSENIAARGISTLQDLANFVPGVNVTGQATQGGRADRSFVGIVLRGMVPSTSAAQTTSIFIDGAPVSTATALQTLTNPERVEIIKGPQSALFGRQTFAGALNVVTKTPSDELSGSISGMIGTRANYDVEGELSAPIITDVLSFRASGRAFGKHGSYKNASVPTETLGDQTTKTGSLALLFRPTGSLKIKAFGLFSELKDGPSAQGLIGARQLTDANGAIVIADQSNCDVTGSSGVATRFFCGVAPKLSGLTPSSNTANDAAITNFLADPSGRVVSPKSGPKGYGLVNHFYHAHLDAQWVLGDTGVTFSSLTSFNSERKSQLNDLDNFNGSNVALSPTIPGSPAAGLVNEGFFNFPFLVEAKTSDFSQEVRASYENGGSLHLTGGGSYLNARNQTANGSFRQTSGVRMAGMQQNRTYGAFGGIGYDFSSMFTLSADARYQVDKLYAYAGQDGLTATTDVFVPVGVYPEGSLLVTKTYKNFLPRVIGQMNIGSKMVYASYSKGVNPGAFNTAFVTSSPEVVAAAQALGYQIAVRPEKITNYEIGTKGKLFDGVVRYDAAAFIAVWTDQIQSQSVFATLNGVVQQATASNNSGKVKISGLEANIAVDLASGLTFDLKGAYINSKIKAGTNASVTALTGITDFRGNQNPFTSKWSGTAGAQYTAPLGTSSFNGVARADFIYKSGTYSDVANIVRTPDMTQVNVRVGVRNESFGLEAFVTNAFNNKSYYNIVDAQLITPGGITPTSAALIAQLRELRTIGIRGTYSF